MKQNQNQKRSCKNRKIDSYRRTASKLGVKKREDYDAQRKEIDMYWNRYYELEQQRVEQDRCQKWDLLCEHFKKISIGEEDYLIHLEYAADYEFYNR